MVWVVFVFVFLFLFCFFFVVLFCIFVLLGLHLRHMEVPRLGVELATAASLYHSHSNSRSEPCLPPALQQLTATLDPNPLSEARD